MSFKNTVFKGVFTPSIDMFLIDIREIVANIEERIVKIGSTIFYSIGFIMEWKRLSKSKSNH